MCISACRSFYSDGGKSFFFFFQAEDGIRDLTVTGVQTCALPISVAVLLMKAGDRLNCTDSAVRICAPCGKTAEPSVAGSISMERSWRMQIGRASCRERV